MTREEAIKWVKFVHDVLYEDKDERIREALNMAISALSAEKMNIHEVACVLADLFGDTCACNYCDIDSWLPQYCDFANTCCPNTVGVACWEQYLTHKPKVEKYAFEQTEPNCDNCKEYGSYKCTKCDGEMYCKTEPSDLISRQALINALDSWDLYDEWGNTTYLKDIIDKLPSVKPIVNNSDLISRADTLAKIKEYCIDGDNEVQKWFDTMGIEEVINTMPSVSAERVGEWILKDGVVGVAYCSNCDYELKCDNINYCPNCGTYMGEVKGK